MRTMGAASLAARPLTLAAMALTLAASVIAAGPGAPRAQEPSFTDWLAALRAEASEAGISATTLDRALGGLEPLPVVVERDRGQAELTLSVDQYLERRLTRATIRTAGQMRRRHARLLARVQKAYAVPPAVIVAVWGLESNFGRFSGTRPTIAALATLAFDPRRASLFRRELLDALRILDRGDIELEKMRGSWAGAMGQPQFMPSSYLRYAVDFDKDGRRDIWGSLPDVFASTASYLKDRGWTPGRTWGREVRLPPSLAEGFPAVAPARSAGCEAFRQMSEPLPLDRWQALGVRTASRAALPKTDLGASLVRAGSRSFLVYGNYEALLAYNCAHAYALSVALLADRIR